MSKKLLGVIFGLLAVGSLASAAPVTCSSLYDTGITISNTAQLTGNDGCTLGSLTFSNFSVTPSINSVFLSSVGAGVVGNEVYLGFQIVPNANPSDTVLMYKVTGATVAVDLAHNGTGSTTIGEVVCDQAFVAGACATGHVLVSYSNPPVPNGVNQFYGTSPGSVGLGTAPTTVWILKDISVPGGSFVSNFTNSHLSPVPEPMTLSMMGIGLLSLGLVRRRQQGKK